MTTKQQLPHCRDCEPPHPDLRTVDTTPGRCATCEDVLPEPKRLHKTHLTDRITEYGVTRTHPYTVF
jgi:hypothetical protein